MQFSKHFLFQLHRQYKLSLLFYLISAYLIYDGFVVNFKKIMNFWGKYVIIKLNNNFKMLEFILVWLVDIGKIVSYCRHGSRPNPGLCFSISTHQSNKISGFIFYWYLRDSTVRKYLTFELLYIQTILNNIGFSVAHHDYNAGTRKMLKIILLRECCKYPSNQEDPNIAEEIEPAL